MSAATKRATLTFDFDTLARDLFRPALDASLFRRLEDVSFERLLPRILAWLEERQIAATFFVIGRHTKDYAEAISTIAARGHEVANHTFHHRREFASLPPAEIAHEIAAGHDALTEAAGRAPVGFRAPGYTLTADVIAALGDLRYDYDASLVPSWFYSTAKHAYRVFGGGDYREYLHPQSVRCAAAPKLPYPIGRQNPFARSRAADLVEIPQTVVGALQFPLIYGLYARLAPLLQRRFERLALSRPFVAIAFHDLEFAAADDLAGLPVGELTRPHVARPLADRLAELSGMTDRIGRSHQFGPLRDVAAAHRFVAEGGLAEPAT